MARVGALKSSPFSHPWLNCRSQARTRLHSGINPLIDYRSLETSTTKQTSRDHG